MYTAEQYAQLALQMSEALQSAQIKQSIIDRLHKEQAELVKLLHEHDIAPPKSFCQEMPF